MNIRCSSCGIPIVGKGYSTFKCPSCNNVPISRCRHCRDQSVKFVCTECGFEGP